MEQMPEFTVANVEQALQVMYTASGRLEVAYKFLNQAELSLEAWSFSWDLLHPAKPLEVQMFGANCLYFKVRKHWQQLKPEQHAQVKELLVTKILGLPKDNSCVLRKLCQVIACMALQQIPPWAESLSRVHFVLTFFHSEMEKNKQLQFSDFGHIIMEALTIFPEEFHCIKMVKQARTNTRLMFRGGLVMITPWMKYMLNESGEFFGPQQKSQVFRCFASWCSEIGDAFTALCDIEDTREAAEALIKNLFQALHSAEMFDANVETVLKLLESSGSEHQGDLLAVYLLKMVNGLQDMVIKAKGEKDMDKLNALCRIMVTAGKKHEDRLGRMVRNPKGERKIAITLLQNIREVGFPQETYLVDEDFSNMAVDFWFFLLEKLDTWKPIDDSEGWEEFLNLVGSLPSKLLTKLQYPADSCLASWSEDTLEVFAEYRQNIQDTLVRCFRMLKDSPLEMMINRLRDMHNNYAPSTWQDMDAIFVALGAVGISGYPSNSAYLPVLMGFVVSVDFPHPFIAASACSMIGAFSRWLRHYADIASRVLPLAVRGLKHRAVFSSAIRTLRQLLSHVEILHNVEPHLQELCFICQEVLKSPTLNPEDCKYVMGCVGFLYSHPAGKALINIMDIVSPHLQAIQPLCSEEPTEAGEQLLVFHLKALSQSFKGLFTQTPTVNKQELGPELVAEITKAFCFMQTSRWKTRPACGEALFEMLEQLLVVDEGHSLAQLVVYMLPEMFESNSCIAMINFTTKVIQTNWLRHVAVKESIPRSVAVTCTRALCSFEKNMEEDPAFVEAFCSLLRRVLLTGTHVHISPPVNMEDVLKVGLKCMESDLHSVVFAGCELVKQFLNSSTVSEALDRILEGNMAFVVNSIMELIFSNPLEKNVELMTDLLYTCHSKFRCACFSLMKIYLSQSHQVAQVPQREKNTFIQLLFRMRCKGEWSRAVKEFMLKMTGIRSAQDVRLPSHSDYELSSLLEKLRPF